MDARGRNALIAVVVLLLVPAALIVLWRALRGPGELVSYVRSGGLAGTTDELVVYRDGKTVLTSDDSTTEGHLAADELAALEDVLDRGDWPAEPKTYGRPFPDSFQIDISYDGHSVRAPDGGPAIDQTPAWLDAVIGELDRLVAQVGG